MDSVFVVCDRIQANRPEAVFARQLMALNHVAEMRVKHPEAWHEFIVQRYDKAATKPKVVR